MHYFVYSTSSPPLPYGFCFPWCMHHLKVFAFSRMPPCKVNKRHAHSKSDSMHHGGYSL
ncbi:hypothetical protein ES319_D01G133600v1 [Gossypium barbadense]|uniref:Uncharacterized protein n=2 Tax=Gossypium TaxID=3633 RepID=A0A5J5SNI7_GOSBA|nr:hypothetical protein ES319_D01G133600v1 [Gossypium barbadense]TYG83132.1 hypothetical protein ES288_D01G144600v1 [Gossypium darwinii]